MLLKDFMVIVRLLLAATSNERIELALDTSRRQSGSPACDLYPTQYCVSEKS